MTKREAILTDWAVVLYPEIYDVLETPETVFAMLNCCRPVALFGKAKSDSRYKSETGEFTDGHRIVTSRIIAVKDGKYHTENTVYTLEDENEKYRQWRREKPDMLLRHICENCAKEELLSSEDGYNRGWDYPPIMGDFRVISPRTCGKCGIDSTLWWEITCKKTPFEQLSERHKQTLLRIMNEPESILPKTEL